MIIILCPDQRASVDAFEMFETWLWENEAPWVVIKCDRNALLIQTDEDLTYLFLHHRFLEFIDTEEDDVIEMEEFFEQLEFVYNERYM